MLCCVSHLLDTPITLFFKQTAFRFHTLSGGVNLSSARGLLSSLSWVLCGLEEKKSLLCWSLVPFFFF